MRNSPAILLLVLASIAITAFSYDCTHDVFASNATKHYLHDLSDHRLLMEGELGRIRIFVDYTQLGVGGQTEVNTIKRIMNITASYFYKVLNVTRLPRLYFPSGNDRKCNILEIPEKYVTEGTIGDLGVVCGNEASSSAIYIAKSTPCAYLQSNKRPIWGMIMFNNAFLKYDQEGFQQILFVGIHEMTHILGFSAALFPTYPGGNPLVEDEDGFNYLSSPLIQEEIKNFYGCPNALGMPLEDQDGTLVASHWEKKIIGNEFMIASNKKGSFVSRFTLALLNSTGWYPEVDYSYAEPSTWGLNKGCKFLNVDDCSSEQFCEGNGFDCDWDGTGIGKCSTDNFAGACKVVKYYTNTICVDESYELKNLNSKLRAFERGGSNSRCFKSSFREEGLKPSSLNNRCYISVCSFSGRFIFILVGGYVLVCRSQGQSIRAPPGFEGDLQCPTNFQNYCYTKNTCPYHCNKNGACVNGQCLCTGETELSGSCMDVSIFEAPIGSSGGLLTALSGNEKLLDGLPILNGPPGQNKKKQETTRSIVKQYSLNSKCIQGTAFDKLFGQCLKCKQIYNCRDCNDHGCISCDDGRNPKSNGHC